MQTVCASGMDHQMKGEYFKMKNHGLRRIFSLFLALFMVFTLLPTTALAEDTTGADETQPKTVVVNEGEKKTDPPAQEQPKNENPPAPEEPKTFTVTYTDGVGGAVFDNDVHSNLPSGTATPAFSGSLAGYTFVGWNPAVAETVTADVTYVAQWEAGKASARRVTLPTVPDPGVAPAALNTGHKIDVTFTVLYVGDEFNIGYNYGSSEKTKFVCQYKTNHSDTAYNNQTIAISDIKAAASRASVNSGYQIVGWSKESNANPTTWSLNKSGTTACNKGSTIYLVAKNPNPTTKYTYTLNYDANGGTGAPSADSWSTTDAAIRYHSFTVKNTIPTREGYVFKGWKANDGSDTIYTGGMTCAVSQYGNDVVKNGNTWTRTLYAVWEEATPPKPDKPTAPGEGDLSGPIGNITVNCTNGKAAHELKAKGYTLISGSYTTNEVAGDAENGYTCTVTINSQKYVEQFDTDTGAAHTPKDAAATVTLKHTDNGWAVERGVPVVFNVVCVTEIVPPAKPGAEDLANLEAPVDVTCTTKPETHAAVHFSLRGGTYTIGDVAGNETDGYTCDITVTADKYVARYNMDYGKHTLTGDNTKTLTLKYVEGQWAVDTPITFPVECEEELFPVHLVIYRNGDTSKAYKDVALESQPKGHVIDLSTIDIADYYTGNYKFYGWYDDGLFNIYKSDPANPPAGLKEKTVNGWTNLKCMVYDKYQVVYFQSEEALRDFQNDHSKTEGRLYSTTALFGSTLPTADAPTPTRTGYTFKFWSREGQNGDVTGQTVNGWTNLYAVWEKNTYTVTYTDGVNGEAFADQAYTAKYEDATPAFEGTPARKGFVFDGWNPEVAETVTDNATYTAQWKPVQPDKKAIEGAIGRGVTVVCDNQNVKHGAKAYKVTLGEYTVSNVMGTAADGYTCTVTVRAAKFIEKYSSDMSDAVHTLIAGEPAEKTIELKWNGEKWVAETELPVTFHTLCPPEQPSKKDIEGAIGRGVKIVCDNQNVNHWGKDYKPTQGEYTVSDVTGTASEGYTCTITVKAAKIIEKYSSDMGKTHALIVGEQAEKAVELKWDGEKWVAKTELPITFHVECPPEKPTYDELKGLGINAKVHCATTTAHTDATYALIGGTYEISDPARKGTVYTCTLTVKAKDYVAKYNAEENVGPHTLDDRDSKTIELTWNGEKWTAAETSVTFNVKCELLTVTYTDGVKGEEVFADVVYNDIPYGTNTPAFGTKDPTRKGYKFLGWEPVVADTVTENATYVAQWEKLYTVTYTDGAKGKAFEDQVFTDLESGTKTPEFNGTPTRKGYKFAGWEPVVSETVTENVTYTAQWEELYTVTYTDGVKGKAFKDQVYSDLESGTATPKFDGKPKRSGYTFTGWSPKVTDTVTKDVTYVAQWKSTKNGKDNVPKTGDSEIVMVLGSVLLFSFCGAAAVSVYDRKRKHF